MAEFLSAGVYIQEVPSKQTTVAGVSTSNFASVGWLQRGPVNKATYVTGPTSFAEKFGGVWSKSDLPLAMTAFFSNGGSRGYIVRVVPSDAAKAQVIVPSGLWKFIAANEGTWANNVVVQLAGNKNYYNVDTAEYSRFDVVVFEGGQQKEIFEAVDLVNPDSASGILTVVNSEIGGSELIVAEEMAGGIPSLFDPTPVADEALGVGAGGATQVITHTMAALPLAKFSLKISVDGVVVAEDDGRGRIVQVGTGYTSIAGSINYTTGSLSMTFTAGVTLADAITADYIKAGSDAINYTMAGGLDGTSISRSDVSDAASLQASKKGLWALDEITEMCMVALPDFMGDSVVANDLIGYCSNRKDFFAILDTPKGSDAQDAYNYMKNKIANQSSYAAIYWPNVKVNDPLLGSRPRVMSNVGHIAGVYARTDGQRNVAKAPAGVNDGFLNFVVDLERVPTKGDMDLLYPANINPLKKDPLTGLVVWGSRTLQLSGDYPQVPWRRLAQFLEKSFFNSSQDLVFEPLTAELFARTSARFSGFLADLTAEGYFASKVPEEAFRFICDETNNTPASIAQRKLIGDCLFAVASPAEFVVMRFERSLELLG
jgi:phage tail sheath protein FI